MDNKINAIANQIIGLPDDDREYIASCVEADEYEVALDYLCDKLLENKIQISRETYNSIESFGKGFGLNEDSRLYWTSIQSLVIK